MKRKISPIVGVILGLIPAFYNQTNAGIVKINEIVVDPQQDHNGSGTITDSDEFVELYNSSEFPVDITGWRLELIDTTPTSMTLEGIVAPRGYSFIQNPPGAQNNDGRTVLYDYDRNLIDAFSYGNWQGNTLGIPNGNANSLDDESLSRYVDGSDNFVKTRATRGYANIPEPKTLVLLGLTGLICAGTRKEQF